MPCLEDVEEIKEKIQRADHNTIKLIYQLLYGTDKGRITTNSLLLFSGFKFKEDSTEFIERINKVSQNCTLASLRDIFILFELNFDENLSMRSLSKMLLQFFNQKLKEHQSKHSDYLEEFERGSLSSYTTLKTTKSKNSAKSQNTLTTLEEISKLRYTISDKKIEIIKMEIELKYLEGAEEEDIRQKRSQIETTRQIVNMLQEDLKNRETFYLQMQNSKRREMETKAAIFEDEGCQSVRGTEIISRRDKAVQEHGETSFNNQKAVSEPKYSQTRVVDWLQENQKVEKENNELQNLTTSINNMLARQTIGQQLNKFDGSSPLKWPIFLSQYKLTGEACNFSPQENVLRLNTSLCGEARKTVELLLITERNPDQILDILDKKYGRPELIMEELISQVKSLSPVEDLQAFNDFSNTVRNIAQVVQNEISYWVDQRHILAMFVNKLPNHLLTQWGSYLVDKEIPPHTENLQHFSNWIQKMSSVMSRVTFLPRNLQETPSTSSEGKGPRQERKQETESKSQNRTCQICMKNETHPIENCSVFKNADIKQRWKLANKVKACFTCLRIHRGQCRYRKICGINNCQRYHHSLLHKNTQDQRQNNAEVSTCVNAEITNGALLKMLPVQIRGPNGVFQLNALLDEGSTTTLIDAVTAQEIGLTGPTVPLCYRWTSNLLKKDDCSQTVQTEIASINSGTFYKLENVRTVNKLDLPWQKFDKNTIIEKFPYAEQALSNYKSNKPTLLIGQNNAELIISRQTIQPYPGMPILSKTKIGWTFHGKLNSTDNHTQEIAILCCEKTDENLHELVKTFMKLENFGVVPFQENKTKSKEDERALQIAKQSICLREQQYEIKLPWKDETPLPESRQMAMQRLKCLEKRLSHDQLLKDNYEAEVQKLLDKNYAIPVDPEEIKAYKRIWFLPHFPVINVNKPGKTRLVFDAAAKSHGSSLNDFLLTGPDMLTSIFTILLKFRLGKFAFSGDIREMFNRVKINHQDTFAQCFFWRHMMLNSEPKIYRMTAMLFGTTSSPFLAQFVKNFNAEQHKEQYPEAAKAIWEKHYVDDYLDSMDCENKAIKIVNDVIHVHDQGGFEIRNFIANSPKILQNIPKHLRACQEVIELGKEERVLGMLWDAETDCFHFNLKFQKLDPKILSGEKIPTKRMVLKAAMSIFDPLGLLSPVTVQIRILLQHIWRSGIGWDDFISNNMFNKWKKWLEELKNLTSLRIPRCYSENLHKADLLELHIFTDASEEMYSTAIFLRILCEESTDVTLVASKARVAPLKTITIPKLELLAAVLGVRLSKEVIKSLNFQNIKKYFWCDSKTVLQWLRTDKKLQTFVALRVGEILEESEVEEWRWVPTSDNVADDCTRDIYKYTFSEKSRWFKGPNFLYLKEEGWPKMPETAKTCFEEVAMPTNTENNYCILTALPAIKSHYSWIKLLRITAQVFRFIGLLQKKKQENQSWLSQKDFEQSQKLWWKAIQCQGFPEDLKNIRNSKPNKNGRLSKISLKIDSEGLLRVSSRILKLEEPTIIEKEPIVLDEKHPYVEKMISHYHKKYGHQGVDTVLNELKKIFYIPHLRTTVKKIIRSCFYCQKMFSKSCNPQMGLLPRERLLTYEKPFTATGIDFFGPFKVIVGRREEKRYGVLFTCLTVRAVHLEISHSLTTDSCIMAIRRFLARRGEVRCFWSDHGKNLRGADEELRRSMIDIDYSMIINDLNNKGINWKYVPPLSPFMGGSWERLIGSFKRAVTAVMKERRPKEEVLQTYFAEVEYILNSRPLTEVSENPFDAISICPNDILIKDCDRIFIPGKFTRDDLFLRKQWRISQYLIDIFWKRWLTEYLPTIIHRNKWQDSEENLQEGEMVVINETNSPRYIWPIGIVTKVYYGQDGIVRVADIKTKHGTYTRPVRKLHRIRVDKKRVNTRGENVEE